MLAYILWNPDPEIFRVGGFVLRWYSMLIAIAFLVSYFLAANMIRRENYPAKIQENGLIYFFFGLIIGARLGHCLFYEPSFYLHHPLEILKIWKGGLSSHGAILGMITGMGIYAYKVKMPGFWFYDKLAVVFTFAGAFIRAGNLLNSEAVGVSTSRFWGFVFVARGEDFARHPAQLYEAIAYIAIFIWLYTLHSKSWHKLRGGYLLGLALFSVFLVRFFVEFLKDPEGSNHILFNLNTGQLLSIPMIVFGVYLVLSKRGKKNQSEHV